MFQRPTRAAEHHKFYNLLRKALIAYHPLLAVHVNMATSREAYPIDLAEFNYFYDYISARMSRSDLERFITRYQNLWINDFAMTLKVISDFRLKFNDVYNHHRTHQGQKFTRRQLQQLYQTVVCSDFKYFDDLIVPYDILSQSFLKHMCENSDVFYRCVVNNSPYNNIPFFSEPMRHAFRPVLDKCHNSMIVLSSVKKSLGAKKPLENLKSEELCNKLTETHQTELILWLREQNLQPESLEAILPKELLKRLSSVAIEHVWIEAETKTTSTIDGSSIVYPQPQYDHDIDDNLQAYSWVPPGIEQVTYHELQVFFMPVITVPYDKKHPLRQLLQLFYAQYLFFNREILAQPNIRNAINQGNADELFRQFIIRSHDNILPLLYLFQPLLPVSHINCVDNLFYSFFNRMSVGPIEQESLLPVHPAALVLHQCSEQEINLSKNKIMPKFLAFLNNSSRLILNALPHELLPQISSVLSHYDLGRLALALSQLPQVDGLNRTNDAVDYGETKSASAVSANALGSHNLNRAKVPSSSGSSNVDQCGATKRRNQQINVTAMLATTVWDIDEMTNDSVPTGLRPGG